MDFELFWGVRDKRTLDSYGESIEKVHTVMPRLLDLFDKYGVKATFATVGFLFAKTKNELEKFSPEEKPKYKDANLSPYGDDAMRLVKEKNEQDPYHYAPKLIENLLNDGVHEVGSHTFSHYYCLEEGQNVGDFKRDIESALAISSEYGNNIKSIVFPRNQVNNAYLKVCAEKGISSYRGTERIWFNSPESELKTTLLKRIFRTLDCYINISGHHTFSLNEVSNAYPYNIRSSRFLRPYNKKLSFLEFMKLGRIKRSMTYAAKRGEIYHLWWHPHNFGGNTEENFALLEEILLHYSRMNQKYGFEGATMSELSKEISMMETKTTPV
ncbi:polysaccharide deacetylase family protein [Flagellimonas sp. S3867]|uniref:polysaccharide deacetylase family protein n=1 Tax=Flagellimonas sp. S3867 TaxID=2768063 RepID=UPI001686FBED|nr:polysaccharide deacetylase family protein [Flagellimonas sp. S3867]